MSMSSEKTSPCLSSTTEALTVQINITMELPLEVAPDNNRTSQNVLPFFFFK